MSITDGTDLKSLQSLWYQKLKEAGFDDIEQTVRGREYLKSWHSVYFSCRYDPQTFEAKEEYYRKASHFLHDYVFPWFDGSSLVNCFEREIWRLHSEGMSMRDIAATLNSKGYQTNKDYVNRIIHKLADVMYLSEVREAE